MLFMNISRSLFLSVIAIVCMQCASAPKQAAIVESCKPTTFRVVLQRGACFGKCPVYVATFTGSAEHAQLELHNQQNMPRSGITTDVLTQAERCAIERLLTNPATITKQVTALESVPDAPQTTLTIQTDKGTVVNKWNLAIPQHLIEIVPVLRSMAERGIR
jgi:hypothetical protein